MSVIAKVASIAKGEIGYHEGRSGGHWNNDQKYSDQVPGLEWSDWQAWCCTFVAWVAMKAGAADLFPRTASCLAAVAWWKKAGRWSEYPAVGAQVLYGAGTGGSHTGIVVAYDADTITVVEGNSNDDGSAEGDGVYQHTRERRIKYVYGYGYPAYEGGSVSADPDAARFGYKYAATGSAPKDSAPAKPKKPAAPKPPAFPGRDKFRPGANNKYVTQLGKQLVKKGYGKHYSVGPGPRWSDADRANVRDFQHAQRWRGSDADGYPGPETWRRLFS